MPGSRARWQPKALAVVVALSILTLACGRAGDVGETATSTTTTVQQTEVAGVSTTAVDQAGEGNTGTTVSDGAVEVSTTVDAGDDEVVLPAGADRSFDVPALPSTVCFAALGADETADGPIKVFDLPRLESLLNDSAVAAASAATPLALVEALRSSTILTRPSPLLTVPLPVLPRRDGPPISIPLVEFDADALRLLESQVADLEPDDAPPIRLAPGEYGYLCGDGIATKVGAAPDGLTIADAGPSVIIIQPRAVGSYSLDLGAGEPVRIEVTDQSSELGITRDLRWESRFAFWAQPGSAAVSPLLFQRSSGSTFTFLTAIESIDVGSGGFVPFDVPRPDGVDDADLCLFVEGAERRTTLGVQRSTTDLSECLLLVP